MAVAFSEAEASWSVALDGDQLHVTDARGDVTVLPLTELGAIAVATNDSGPVGADFWWWLFDRKPQLVCIFPQGAIGEEAATKRLMALPGFDHEQMEKAILSTREATFPVWRR